MILPNCFVSVASGNYFYFLQRLTENLQRPPDSLEDFKIVLGAIANIRSMSFKVEVRYLDIWERYRTLAMYNIPVSSCLLNHFRFELGAQMPLM